MADELKERLLLEIYNSSVSDREDCKHIADAILPIVRASEVAARAVTWEHVFQGIEEPCGCVNHRKLFATLDAALAQARAEFVTVIQQHAPVCADATFPNNAFKKVSECSCGWGADLRTDWDRDEKGVLVNKRFVSGDFWSQWVQHVAAAREAQVRKSEDLGVKSKPPNGASYA